MKYFVTVSCPGYVIVDAEDEREAMEMAEVVDLKEINWDTDDIRAGDCLVQKQFWWGVNYDIH